MRIAIVSDTHGNITNFKKIVNWVNKNKIDLILHAGDIGDVSSLKESLQEFKGKLFGVFGNMDKDYKILAKEYNKIKNVEIKENIFEFVFDNVRIAVNHFPNIAKKMAESEKYDLVFYGHTHRPWVEKIGKCFLANPGEAAGQINKPSFAVYDTETKKLELKILEKL